MNTKRGITVLTLGVIIIVMTILLSIISISGSDIYENAMKVKLESEINQIEVLVNNYMVRNSGIDFDTMELDISSYTANEIAQFDGETITDGKITLYIVDLDEIDAEEVSYGMLKNGEDDRYLYSSTTKKVYYEKGIDIKSETYHRI